MFPASCSKLVLLLTLSSLLNVAISAPLSTIAISHISEETVVCSLLPSGLSDRRYNLTCTTLPSGRVEIYDNSGVNFYSAIAAGDGFLCSVGGSGNSIMDWWNLANGTGDGVSHNYKRVYRGEPILKLSTGDSRVCALLEGSSQRPFCWRWPEMSFPVNLSFSDISVGGDFVCGLTSDRGEIKCFGSNTSRVIGNEPSGSYILLAAGTRHACAVSNASELVCWGVGAPVVGPCPFDISALESGKDNTCALSSNGTVQCWGANSDVPSGLAKLQFVAIEARGYTFCGVLKANYSLLCWGIDLFKTNPVIYRSVLPGACVPPSSCSCGFLAGSANMCPSDSRICDLCDMEIKVNPAPNTLTPQGSSNGAGGRKRKITFMVITWVGAGLVAFACLLFVLLRQTSHKVHDPDRMHSTVAVAAARISPCIPCLRLGPREGADHSPSTSSSQPPLSSLHCKNAYMIEEFSLAVLHDVTEKFSEDYKIASGSFGSVYRAVLDDGRVVAIKRAESSGSRSGTHAAAAAAAVAVTPQNRHRQDVKESAFMSELALLPRVNHKNLVRLLGYCYQGVERVLVYEFMANGTLHDHLHKRPCSSLATWRDRLQVALDAARGIEYLHVYAVPPIIHRDIKSSNILLDETWTARVSDFGLSLMRPAQNELDSDSSRSRSFRMAGTIGYMDPESFRLQNMTTKSDVYSFGVVLLELLTGRKAIHKYDDDEDGNNDGGAGCGTPTNLVEFAVPHILDDDLHHVLDPELSPPTPCEIEAVTFVSFLAADCVLPEGKDRPSMTEVVAGLERAVDALGAPPHSSVSRSDLSHNVGLVPTSARWKLDDS